MQDASQTALEKGQRLYLMTIHGSDVETLPTHLLGLISTHLPLSTHTSQVSKMIHSDHDQVSLSLWTDWPGWHKSCRWLSTGNSVLCAVWIFINMNIRPSLHTPPHGWLFSFHRTQEILRRKFWLPSGDRQSTSILKLFRIKKEFEYREYSPLAIKWINYWLLTTAVNDDLQFESYHNVNVTTELWKKMYLNVLVKIWQ